ncbi:PREDICTED: uncharacterized protein LOC106341536 [Brassica oleracea var. oleracea]|uniref:uncharacterized protein LOC106341536 n=1 Tax=Brassica oleracea var. oleracea TaxID=109376 RepID=UPI0006A709D3|nr:PREDICTED: uncharacterized protein LOC106341536 [Brassica oleracea var. oleracea]
MVQFVYKSLNIGTNSLMFRVIDVFILKSIKGLINLCIIGVNYSCDREALYSHGRRRWETSSVGLNGRGNMTSELYVNISWPLYQNMFMLLRFTHTGLQEIWPMVTRCLELCHLLAKKSKMHL